MRTFELKYNEEDDTLEVFWAQLKREDMTGFELEADIVLHTDKSLSQPVRLALSAYSKIVQETCIELTNLPLMPPEKQERVRTLLREYPLNRFLQFDGENSVRIVGAVVSALAA